MADKHDLTSRKARAKLAVQNTIYWKTLKPGKLHLGYAKRKASVAGIWIMRVYLGTEITGTASPYQKQNLGSADDLASNDCLSFVQAQQKAFELHVVREKQKKAGVKGGPLTLAEVTADYLLSLKARGKSSIDERRRFNTHVLPKLGKMKVEDLAPHQLEKWFYAMAAEPKRLRTGEGKPQNFAAAPDTPEKKRQRQSTANKTLQVLKAALNQAFRSGRVHDDTAWRLVKPFKNVDSARPAFFTVAEAQRLINAADPSDGFRDLLHGALLTGCRYGELCRLKVADFQRGRIVVHISKSGKPRDVRLTQEGRDFFTQITTGRKPGELMFHHADGRAWNAANQARPMRAACFAAGLKPVGFHQTRHTYASLSCMNKVPLLVIARNLGHLNGTKMVEQHYGHLTEDYQDAEIEKGAPTFGIMPESNVVPFKGAK